MEEIKTQTFDRSKIQVIKERRRCPKTGRFLKGYEPGTVIMKKLSISSRKRMFCKDFPNYKGRKLDSGYVLIYNPDHPYSEGTGHIYEHRLVMEAHIGRYLTKEEVIHHIDGDKENNKIENLMLFKNNSDHLRYHKKIRDLKNGK